MSTQFCAKCKKTLDEINFYTYKNGQKVEQCKKCMTMHIDNYDEKTFLWLLEKMDVPYVKEEWDTLRDRAAQKANQDHKTLTGMSIFGKYLSKMKLKQWQGYTWADSEQLRADRDNKLQNAYAAGVVKSADSLKQMFEEGEISEAEFLTLSEEPAIQAPSSNPGEFNPYPINNPGYEMIDIPLDLTDEDKIHLAMKWGRLYRPDQWVALETLYTKMMDSFDVQSAAREDTLVKLCKTSLKMEEAIDCGDVDNFQKLGRVYDTLLKSGKFSEAQNKDDGKGSINSIGEAVAICEREGGFIPRFDLEFPKDIVDKTIADMNKYTYNLVTKDMGLGQQIEDAIKKIQIQREMDEDELKDELAIEDIERVVLEDADFQEFFDEVELQKTLDSMDDA